MKKILLLFFIPFVMSLAQVSFSKGDNINENFDSIGTIASATLPANWKADKVSTVRTIGLYSSAVNKTELSGGISLSTSAQNGIYNFEIGNGTTPNNRAIGGHSSGSNS